jgi:hypothetical protein
MALDSDAKEITLNYTGGSLTMTRGNAKDLFGENNSLLDVEGEEISTAVKAHTRTRVIGGGTTNVAAHTREYIQWPTSQANNAAAGTLIYMSWEDSEGTWSARATGSMAVLATFLNAAAAKPVAFRTARGTKYGPFAMDNNQ